MRAKKVVKGSEISLDSLTDLLAGSLNLLAAPRSQLMV